MFEVGIKSFICSTIVSTTIFLGWALVISQTEIATSFFPSSSDLNDFEFIGCSNALLISSLAFSTSSINFGSITSKFVGTLNLYPFLP